MAVTVSTHGHKGATLDCLSVLFFHCRLLLLPLSFLFVVVVAVVFVGGEDKSDARLDEVPNNVLH